ncbi:MAG: helix-turn-helix transcriptional regulator [Clostridia bacterium]|nr:helix-turn-helix transcriptional regulator [Clostridia bacterium]
MELGKKIQSLRLSHGLTQEAFAKKLFVSRTAVSKWETGRGTPNIESLKMIAAEFSVTLDELLMAEEAISVCENEHRENIARIFSKLDAVSNAACALALVLPLFKAENGGAFYSVPLYAFDGRFCLLFWIIPILLAVCGCIQLLIRMEKVQSILKGSGSILNAGAVFLFILCGQIYPAVLFFALFLLKIAFFYQKSQMTRKESRM